MIFIKSYKLVNNSSWTGRIDNEDDFKSYRWHQWVKTLDLNEKNIEPKENLSFAFLGYACDKGIIKNMGSEGAALGPDSIRTKLSNLPCHFTKEVSLFDAGDIVCEKTSVEEAQDDLSKAVKKLLKLNIFPILIGGGHDIAFGHYKGIYSYLKDESKGKNIGIINFDAHFDLRPYPKGSTSGTAFNQISEFTDNEDIDYSYLCLGIQELGNTISLFNRADELGVDYILAKDIKNIKDNSNTSKIDEFIKDKDHIYITICSDVFSSAYAPGVSAPQPLGLHPDILLFYLEHILNSKKVISFDIAEISPKADLNNLTSSLASNIIYSIVDLFSKNV